MSSLRSLMLRAMIAIALISLPLSKAHAQLGAGPEPREPFISASLATGVLFLQLVEDGRSRSIWEFDAVQQFRAALDRNVAENTTIGVTFGYAALAMEYGRLGPRPAASPTCGSRCRATADLWTLGATLRMRGEGDFHQFAEISVAANQFSNFREVGTVNRLAPLDGDRDFSFIGGYGMGWAPGRRFELSAVMDAGFVLHGRSGRESDRNQLSYLFMLRLIVRSGLGP